MSSLWLYLETNVIPISIVCFVCLAYYVIRTRIFPDFRPNEYKIGHNHDFEMRIAQMKSKAAKQVPFSDKELDVIVLSFQHAMGNFSNKILYSEDFDEMEKIGEDKDLDIDWMCLRGLVAQVAHKTHKDWLNTERSADLLAELIGTPDTSDLCCRLLHRVLEDGGWWDAEEYAIARVARNHSRYRLRSIPTSANPTSSLRFRKQSTVSAHARIDHREGSRPWVVVVCGLNGIRKSTSVQQPWFQELLYSALGDQYSGELEDLPNGSNSFFRQLDFMMATVACEDFRELYTKAGLIDVAEYSKIKDAIFARYRTLSEMIGIILLKEARLKGMNVMVETSGKDVASFRYVNHLFPCSPEGSTEHREYNKLMVHFVIDDICFAEQSVDKRMTQEMRDGEAAVSETNFNFDEVATRRVISVNSGGPYGSAVLQQVQHDSDTVMNAIFDETRQLNKEEEFHDWYKARISIRARKEGWSACSCNPDGKELKTFQFEEWQVKH